MGHMHMRRPRQGKLQTSQADATFSPLPRAVIAAGLRCVEHLQVVTVKNKQRAIIVLKENILWNSSCSRKVSTYGVNYFKAFYSYCKGENKCERLFIRFNLEII